MNIQRGILLPLLALYVFAGCGGYQDEYSGDAPTQSSPPAPPSGGYKGAPEAPGKDGNSGGNADSPAQTPLPEPVQRKIIRNGQLTIKVESVDSTDARLARIAAANNGYISNTSRFRYSGNAISGTTELRIPSERFDAVLAAIKALGDLDAESISTSDVTAEFIDLNARLKTQQELEARLLALLQERGAKLADVIEVESKLAQVRTEIESIQGRLRFMQQQVSYSTLSITMVEPGAVGVSSTETFGGRMERAFRMGIDGLVDVVGVLITAILALLPLLALGAGLYFLVLRPWFRRRRAKREEQKEKPVQKEKPETAMK